MKRTTILLLTLLSLTGCAAFVSAPVDPNKPATVQDVRNEIRQACVRNAVLTGGDFVFC